LCPSTKRLARVPPIFCPHAKNVSLSKLS
jgi:hypothetical protein